MFDRDSLAHMTCSIWTVDPTVTQTLTVFHNTYRSWSWIGGHADGERDLSGGAARIGGGDGAECRRAHRAMR